MKQFFVLQTCAAVSAITLLAASPSAGIALNNAVRASIDAQQVPGAQVIIVRRGKDVIYRTYGLANLHTRVAVRPDTRFEIGSITKQMTAAAILQLREQGKLRLSDRLAKYVPEYGPGKDVTLEQMLWHVSGIPDFMFVKGFPAFWKLANASPGSFDAVLDLIKDAPLQFTPGTQYAYSNSNYVLLAKVVERASGVSWRQYVRQNIFQRAGMTRSAFMGDEAALSDAARGYRKNRGALVTAPSMGRWVDGAGSTVSTAGDVAKWDAAFFGGKIISMQDVKLATTSHVLPSGQSTGEGFGWTSDTFDGTPRFWYTGRTFGFTAENEYFPSLREAIVVLTNTANERVSYIAGGAFEALNPSAAVAARTPAAGEDPRITSLARQWIHRLQTGDIDSSRIDARFAAEGVSEDEQAVKPLGTPTAFVYRGEHVSRAATNYEFWVDFTGASLLMVLSIEPDGKIAAISFLPR